MASLARRGRPRRAVAAHISEATLDEVAREVCSTFDWPWDLDRLPSPFRRVMIVAGDDDHGVARGAPATP
jgi:hypothetical protein